MEAGEPSGKEKFEKITVTVKSFEKYVPFEKVLNAEKLPKDSEAYYLLLSKKYLHLIFVIELVTA